MYYNKIIILFAFVLLIPLVHGGYVGYRSGSRDVSAYINEHSNQWYNGKQTVHHIHAKKCRLRA